MEKRLKLTCIITAIGIIVCGCQKDGMSGPMMFDSYPAMAEVLIQNPDGGKFDEIVENDFINAAEQPVSTFSVDADGASYSFIKKCLENNQKYNKDAIRIEEFINYFPFNYAEPSGSENVALNSEIGNCPWDDSHKIMRLGIKGKSLKDSERPTANFVFLIDVSGSMNAEDKLPLLKNSLLNLVDNLSPEDRISIVTYSGTVRKLLESTAINKGKASIKKAIKKLTASGSTAGGEAMKMAYEEALHNFVPGGNNRVIMGTDGDFNVGVKDTDQLLEMVQDYAKEGIYLTVCGFGYGNLNDSMMETVADNGNGTYEYIADEDSMIKVFVNESSKFVSVADDCKIQVTFNPEAVAEYRLIGYENRIMDEEDFENDEKDASEIGAGQTITALYEIVPAEGCDMVSDWARFDFRYKKGLMDSSHLIKTDVTPDAAVSEDFDFACSVAAFGMILRESKYKGNADFEMVKDLATNGSRNFDPYGYRNDFLSLVAIASAKE